MYSIVFACLTQPYLSPKKSLTEKAESYPIREDLEHQENFLKLPGHQIPQMANNFAF